MQQDQTNMQTDTGKHTPARQSEPVEMPQCCGTGCTVCVLDYPELFSSGQSGGQFGDSADGQFDPETLAMLEAIEQAQLQASQLLAESNGDLQ